MEVMVLNDEFEIIDYIDNFTSLEWVQRYYEAGEFVMNLPYAATGEDTSIKRNRYLQREDSEAIMIIENVKTARSSSAGNSTEAKGRSMESILERRIVWKQTNTKAGETVEVFLRRLVTENCISPTDTKRKIPRLKLGTLQGFTEKMDKQITGDDLLTVISDTCKTYQYGFKITLDDEKNLVFQLYKGTDRSYDQQQNPYVVFSDDYDNLVNTEHEEDQSNYANVALIGGEGEGTDRRYQTIGTAEGMERYEMFVDAKDVSSNNGEIAEAEYNNLLIERGNEKLAENIIQESYTGEVETTRTYIFREDYGLGDIVQIEDEGRSAKVRVLEAIESENGNGYKVVPTFGTWEVQIQAWQL